MASKHTPAIVAAAASAVLVLGVGLAMGSDDEGTEVETADGTPDTTADDGPGTTEGTRPSSTGTSTAPSSETTASSVSETTATTGGSGTTATTARPGTTQTTAGSVTTQTTQAAPPRFAVVSGPVPDDLGYQCHAKLRVRNVGGSSGQYSVTFDTPGALNISPSQGFLQPGVEQEIDLHAIVDRDIVVGVEVANLTMGVPDEATVAVTLDTTLPVC